MVKGSGNEQDKNEKYRYSASDYGSFDSYIVLRRSADTDSADGTCNQ